MTTPQHNPSADEALVEAMARAIHDNYRGRAYDMGASVPEWEDDDMDPIFREIMLSDARAALAAARSHGGM